MPNIRSSPEEIERFRKLIQQMSRDSMIYKMLKEELTAQGYWKNKARGKPKQF
jgi:hypothetical protein